jgi:TolA-binding protein
MIPSQVRAARSGAYPNAIRDYIKGGNYGAALDIVNKWEETFPTEKPLGHTFFWRGKLLALRGQHQDAARYLARAIGLAVGASFESESRWLLAGSLEQIGRPDDAKKELAKLVASGLNDEFSKLAKEKLSK